VEVIVESLVKGVHRFQREVVETRRAWFAQLAEGQTPEALFITCSDSRINPNLLTQTDPGELFLVRNAGNIIPSSGSGASGELGTIEFAVQGLGIEHVIVCGHSDCGAMKALLDPSLTERMPAMRAWLGHAELTKRVLEENYKGRSPEEMIDIAIQENVLCQIENLRTHPAIAARLRAGRINLHAWVYDVGSGEVFSYDADENQFKPLRDLPSRPRERGSSKLITP
jgi:carbonic anhydrase